VLYGPDDPGHRYVQRMQQAVHVLYGTASPAEALQAATVPEGRLDLDAFLSHVAANAHYAGIADVVYEGGNKSGSAGAAGAVIVRADEFALEDVVTHILRNADSYRPAGTAITLSLSASESTASATLHNQGATIAEDLLERIFELGVSAPQEPSAASGAEHRGQGLFVARTYMAKMGGTIRAHNTRDGVAFTLTFPRLGCGPGAAGQCPRGTAGWPREGTIRGCPFPNRSSRSCSRASTWSTSWAVTYSSGRAAPTSWACALSTARSRLPSPSAPASSSITASAAARTATPSVF
jgi:hypothetical protein